MKISEDQIKNSKIEKFLSEKDLPCSIPVDVPGCNYYSELKIHRQLENGELDRVLMDWEGDIADCYEEAIQGRERIGKHCNFYSKQGILDYLAFNYGCEIILDEN